MSGLSASGLKTMIKNYTEVDSTVFTDDILENLILNAQQRIFYDVPVDSDRVEYQGTVAADTNTVRVPAGMVFVRGVEVFNSTSSRTGPATWLQKRDRTFLNEYVNTTDEDGNLQRYLKTEFYSDLGSLTPDNVTLSALTKQEEYLGLVFKPEVESEVFINRGVADIFERHALLCEIKTTNDIDTNRGGFIRT